MKIVVTGTRGIPIVMGCVETHCEELFPRIASFGEDVTIIRRASYVNDGLTEWKVVKLEGHRDRYIDSSTIQASH